jgi:hypothetical protein
VRGRRGRGCSDEVAKASVARVEPRIVCRVNQDALALVLAILKGVVEVKSMRRRGGGRRTLSMLGESAGRW